MPGAPTSKTLCRSPRGTRLWISSPGFSSMFSTNAIQAMNGQGDLWLTTEEQEVDYHQIRDNGPGIPNNILAKCSIRFIQPKARAKDQGLGLTVSQTVDQSSAEESAVESPRKARPPASSTLPADRPVRKRRHASHPDTRPHAGPWFVLLLCASTYSLHAKDVAPAGIAPESRRLCACGAGRRRTIYTDQVVNRMQARGSSAVEHWEHENALPLPAQFLQHSGKLVAVSPDRGIFFFFRLAFGRFTKRNAPCHRAGRKALKSTDPRPAVHRDRDERPPQYPQTIYSDRAVSAARVRHHNNHPLSPQTRLCPQRCHGGMTITIPLD